MMTASKFIDCECLRVSLLTVSTLLAILNVVVFYLDGMSTFD